jgi:hypothetical protein
MGSKELPMTLLRTTGRSPWMSTSFPGSPSDWENPSSLSGSVWLWAPTPPTSSASWWVAASL